MRRILALCAILIVAGCSKPLVVKVTDLPDNTPLNEPIFIVGNFNHWQPGDPSYQITRDSEGGGYIEIPRGIGEIEYKFTRGDWSKEEVDSCGSAIENRVISNLEMGTVEVQIEQWRDMPTRFCNGIELYIQVPRSTPIPNEIYVSGEFNNWTPAQTQFKAEHLGANQYYIQLPGDYKGSFYKVTRGTWNTVEVSAQGEERPDRVLNDASVQRIEVDNWKDVCLQEHPYRYLVIRTVPEQTPSNAMLHFASNINGWNPDDKSYVFDRMRNGDYILRLPNQADPIEYKITRGSGWGTVEVAFNGFEIPNRRLEFGITDTIQIDVANWKDQQ